jgi:hypothetical protein
MNTNINFPNAIEHLKNKLTPSALAQINNVFTFEFKDIKEFYTLDGSQTSAKGWLPGKPEVYGLASDFQVTITTDDFAQLVFGQLNPMAGMVSGRMKLKGNIKEALKLDRLLKD